MDQSAVDVNPDRVILRAIGDFSTPDARRFSSAYASDFERHDVLENILDPNQRLTPGMTLSRTSPLKGRHSKKKQPPVQLMCLALDMDPVSELVALFHEAIEGELVAGPVCQIADGSTLQGNHPRVLVISSHAQERLQARDLKLTSILTDVITTCPDMICVLSDGTITRARELSLLAPDAPPKPEQNVPKSMSEDETNNEGILAYENTPSDEPEPSL